MKYEPSRLLTYLRAHTLAQGATAAAASQAIKYLAPLIVLPYLTRILSAREFGIVSVSLAAIQLAFVVTDYGFSVSAAADIASHNGERVYTSGKIGTVFLTKIPLTLLVVAILLLAPHFIGSLRLFRDYFASAVPAVCAMAFQPTWLFLGIERLAKVTKYVAVTQCAYVLLVLLIVRAPGDGLRVIYAQDVAQLIGTGVALYLLKRTGYRIKLTNTRSCLNELRRSAQYFFSHMAVATYTSLNVVILGSLGAVGAARYAACEQIYNAGKTVTSPLHTALLPYMTRTRNWAVFKRLVTVTGITLVVGCFVVAANAKLALTVAFGAPYGTAGGTLSILCISVILVFIGDTFGYPAFSALGNMTPVNVSLFIGMVVQVATVTTLYQLHHLNDITMAFAVLAAEGAVALYRCGTFVYYGRIDARIMRRT